MKKYIAKILGVEPLRLKLSEDEILEILKRRLTKKQKKFFLLEVNGLDEDNSTTKEIKKVLYAKLRHPKIRNELIS